MIYQSHSEGMLNIISSMYVDRILNFGTAKSNAAINLNNNIPTPTPPPPPKKKKKKKKS